MSGKRVSHIDVRPDWLALNTEEAIEPELPIVDAHHHIYKRDDRLYLLPELLDDFGSGHNVEASVYIECRTSYGKDDDPLLRPLGETAYVAELADGLGDGSGVCAAIVGNVDLLQAGGRAAELLEAHVEVGRGRFRGIRNTSAWHADPTARGSIADPPHDLLQRESFREGFACLGKAGLSFDAWLYHTQFEDLIGLANAFPDTPIVLNHLGGPIGIGPYAGRRDEVFADWKAELARLAECENVALKLGGLGMRMFGFDFHEKPLPPSSRDLASGWRPYIETGIEAFGADRCMFESNFPVDKGMCSYRVLWNSFKRITEGYSADERTELFSGTARRFYRI